MRKSARIARAFGEPKWRVDVTMYSVRTVHWYTGRFAEWPAMHCTSVLGTLVQLQSRWCNYSVTAIYWAGGPQGNQQGAPLQFSNSVLLIVIIIIIDLRQCLAHCHHHWHSSASSASCSTSSSLTLIRIITHEQGHHHWHYHHHQEGREREEDRDELICNARMPLPLVLSFSRPETPPLTSTKIRQC